MGERSRGSRLHVRLGANHGRQRVGDVLAGKRTPPREHLEQHGAECPDVRAVVDRLFRAPAPAPCRRRCRESSHARHRAGVVSVGDIDALAAAALAGSARSLSRGRSPGPSPCRRPDLDVGGFEIAVDDALLVRGLEGLGDLPRNRQRVGDRDGALRAIRSSRVVPSTSSITRACVPSASSKPVDRRDVGVIQGREHFRFTLESRESIGVARRPRRAAP